MIAMLDTNENLQECAEEMQAPCEQLLTPLTRFKRTDLLKMFAIDNGAYSGFKAKAFLALLEREMEHRELCRFVVVPDVVGSARRTLEVFREWKDRLEGWPIALAAQDGLEAMRIPWEDISCLFIGGSTEWKLGPSAEHCIRAAKILGKWVHVGRVNTPIRWEQFERLGVDSIDGSGLARFSHMRQAVGSSISHPKLPLNI